MSNWFKKSRREFAKLAMLKQGCGVYVEVGCWKGDSAEWVMQNVRPKDAYGLDPYPPDAKHSQDEVDQIYKDTKKRLAAYAAFKLFRYDSQVELRLWPPNRGLIDLLYLDGRHDAAGVVLDFCLAWHALNEGAIVIFDDFGIGKRKTHRHVPEAFEALCLAFGDQVEVIHRGPKQAALKIITKIPPMEPKMNRLVGVAARRARREARNKQAT